MLIIFLDTETTGLDSQRHRVLEIAFKIYDSQKNRIVVSYSAIINQPSEVLALADPQSMEVNGFTDTLVMSGKSERAVSAEIIGDFNRAGVDKGNAVFVCQNPSFDRTFFNQLVSVQMQTEFRWPYHWLDLASMYWARKGGQISEEKELSKNAIASSLGLAREADPHRAMNGVIHLMQCYCSLFSLSIPELEADARSAQRG
ncbi:MAG: Oligoribonuclease [Chlamydiales bacterium]|nr:Oligoribonuclease [Chlamydiales bacterium]MCH9634960.1 Oligoribonuclease [Chlamydiales bacterium]MCH9704419.1 3'-5' exonuclease [Chlamydiota bacterium]